jgi:ABC-type lipoprotein release transport system permease subunit
LSLWLALLLAVPLGGILSILAAIYPAWRAAKMPPAAALRSEF